MEAATKTTDTGAPTTGTPTPTPSLPQKNSTAGAVILGVIVLVFGFVIYKGVTGTAVPETPEGVVERMMYVMKDVKTGEFAGTLAADIEGVDNPLAGLENLGQVGAPAAEETGEPKKMALTIGLSGVADVTTPEQTKASVKISLASSDFPEGESGEVEFITTEANNYFKLNKLPSFGGMNLKSLTGNWINLDTKALKEQFGSDETPAPTVSTTPLSDDKQEQIKDIIAGAKILTVSEDKGDTSVAGVSVYHYGVSVNEAEVMRMVREISEITGGKAMTIEEEQKMVKFWANTDVENGSIMIGKKDFYLYGMSFDVKMDKTDEEPTSGTLTADLQMRNFNKPVTIQTPESPMTIADFMGQVIGAIIGAGMMGGGR